MSSGEGVSDLLSRAPPGSLATSTCTTCCLLLILALLGKEARAVEPSKGNKFGSTDEWYELQGMVLK